MAYIEYQLSAPTLFLAIAVGSAGRRSAAIGQKLTFGSSTFLVSDAQLGSSALRSEEPAQFAINWTDALGPKFDLVPGDRVQIIQQVSITLRQVTSNGDGSTTLGVPQPFAFAAVLLLDASVSNPFQSGSSAPLTITLERIEGGLPSGDLLSLLRYVSASIFPPSSISLPLGQLYGDSRVQVILSNAGVSTDQGLTRLAIRLELGNVSEDVVPGWKDFHAGVLFDSLNSNVQGPSGQWAVLVSVPLVEEFVARQLESSMDQHRDRFRVNGGTVVQWFPFGGSTPSLKFNFNGDAINACPGVNTDINYDVKGTVDISVSPPGILRSSANVDWSGNLFELAACELAVGLFASLVGVAIVGSFGALGGFGIGFIGSLIGATVYSPDLSSSGCTQPSKHELDCTWSGTYSFNFSGQRYSLLAQEAVAVPPGMVLLGGFPTITPLKGASVVVSVKDFVWAPPVLACGSLTKDAIDNVRRNMRSVVMAIAGLDIENSGDGRLVVSRVERISADPFNMFPQDSISLNDYGASWSVQVTAPFNAAYEAAPYPLRLLLTTNGGLQEVVIPPIAVLSDDIVGQFLAALDGFVGRCTEAVDGFWGAVGQFNPQWLVDPPPEGVVDNRSWQVQVIGLVPGETIKLVEGALGSATEVAQGVADATGVARVTAILAGGLDPSPVGLVRTDRENAGPRRQDQLIVTKQIDVVRQASVPLPGRGLQVAAARLQDRPHLFVLCANGVVDGFDVLDPSAPVPVLSAAAPGARGMLITERGLLAWGPDGLVLQPLRGASLADSGRSGDGSLRVALDCCAGCAKGREVLGVTRSGTELFVLQRERILALDARSLKVLAERRIDCQNAKGIVSTKHFLVVGDDRGLALFDVDRHAHLHPAGQIEVPHLRSIHTYPVVIPRTAVYVVQRSGKGEVLDLGPGPCARVAARYPSAPWFTRSANIDRVIGSLAADAMSLDIRSSAYAVTA